MLSIFVAVAGRPCVPSPPSEVSESKPLSPLLRLHTQYMYITAKGLNSIPFQRDIKDLFTFSFFFYCIYSCTYSIYLRSQTKSNARPIDHAIQ